MLLNNPNGLPTAIVIVTKQKAAMTKFECDGYNNKFNVNNNKI